MNYTVYAAVQHIGDNIIVLFYVDTFSFLMGMKHSKSQTGPHSHKPLLVDFVGLH